MDLLTQQDYFRIGRNYCLTRDTRIDPKQVDIDGSDVNIFVGTTSGVAQAVTQQLADRFAARFLDGAYGEDVDRWAYDQFDGEIVRKDASAALVVLRFFRATTAAGSGSIPIGFKCTTSQGIEYVLETQATFSATATSATAEARATRAGHEYQVGRNQIRTMPTAPFDSSIQVTNDEPSAGGEPREDDDTFKDRLRSFWPATRRGTIEAIVEAAKATDGVYSASGFEDIEATDSVRPARIVKLWIADSSGLASVPLANKVRAKLEDFRAGGIAVIIELGIPQMVDIALSLTFTANADTATVFNQIRSTIFGYVNALPVNGVLYRAELNALLSRFKASGLMPSSSAIAEPAGDLVPDLGRCIRTTLDRIILI